MIFSGAIISKDKDKFQIGEGLKLVQKGFWINKYKGI